MYVFCKNMNCQQTIHCLLISYTDNPLFHRRHTQLLNKHSNTQLHGINISVNYISSVNVDKKF